MQHAPHSTRSAYMQHDNPSVASDASALQPHALPTYNERLQQLRGSVHTVLGDQSSGVHAGTSGPPSLSIAYERAGGLPDWDHLDLPSVERGEGGPGRGSRSVTGGQGSSKTRSDDVSRSGSLWTREFVNQAFFQLDRDADQQLVPPAASVPLEQRIAWLHHQLDGFDPSRHLLSKYESLGPTARRQGGAL